MSVLKGVPPPVFLPQKIHMQEALALANEAGQAGEIPVGAVVVLNGAVIGRGRNRRESDKNPFGHAEMSAIAEATNTLGDWRLTGAILYVSLEPCPMCAGAAINSRIAHIVFGAEDPRAGCCGSLVDLTVLPFCHRPAVYRGFMELEAKKQLTDFFAKMRHTKTKHVQKESF